MLQLNNTVIQSPSEDLGAVYTRLQHGLRSYLRRQVRDSTIAEDLLQEVFLKALAAEHQFGNLTGWLYAVARTTVVDYYRAIRLSGEELDDNIPNREMDDGLLHQELATCLRPMIEQLPTIYRDTLLATDIDGETMQSVAAKQGLSVSAIKSRASRARAMLRDKVLECCHVEMSDGTVTDYRRRSASPGCGSKCV
ncbi:MAG: sigma-70 family RNA polymerase sigma factor [Pseudomonadota bacterium]